ncbi:O-antigen polymerase [Vibrio parahaemolyticus]
MNWILVWALIASFNIFGAEFYPTKSLLLFLFFVSILMLFAIGKRRVFVIQSAQEFGNYQLQFVLLEKLVKIIYFAIIPIMIIVAIKSIILLQSYNIYDFRREVFSSDSGVLPSGFLPIYTLIIGGLSKFSLIVSIFLFSKGRGKKYVLLPFIVSVLSSVITLGRFPIYEFILLLVLSLYTERKITFKHVIYGALGFTLLIGFSMYRSGGYYGLSEILQRHIIGYHTYGFYLLEYKIDSTNVLSDSWLGLASTGSFGYFISLPFTWVSNFVTYMQSSYFLLQDDFVRVGSTMDGRPMLVNAFYTILYEPYLDFGFIGVLAQSLIIGFIIRVLTLSSKARIVSEAALIFIGSILISGIMKSPFIRHDIIIPCFLFFILYFIFKQRNVNE